jgi:hypothetical protein
LTTITVAVEKIADNMYSVEPDGTYVVSCSSSVTCGSIVAIAPFLSSFGHS